MTDQLFNISPLLMPTPDARRTVSVEDRTYTLLDYLGDGGTGEVYKCCDDQGRSFALKLYLPRTSLFRALPGKASTVTALDPQIFVDHAMKIVHDEYQALKGLDHPNVLDVFAVDDLKLTSTDRKALPPALGDNVPALPVMLSEFIDGATLEDHISTGDLDKDTIISILAQIASALDYIHAHNLLHADVHASNVLIRSTTGQPVLIDFASTKNLNIDPSVADGKTLLAVDTGRLSPKIPAEHPLRMHHGLYELRRGELKEEYFPWFDVMQFALLLGHVLSSFEPKFSHNERDYLSLLIRRFDYPACRADTVPITALVQKLRSFESYPYGVPELVAPSAAINAVSLTQHITVPLVGVGQAFSTNLSFQRLSRIRQLSFLSIVYPAADHKRLVHALHTYEISRQLSLQLLGTAAFRYLFDREDVQALLACALLHDINHFPFLHTLQEAMNSEGKPLIENDTVLDLFCEGDVTGEHAINKLSIYEMLEEIGISKSRFQRLLFQRHSDQTSPVDQVINSIISSTVDVDKISYLMLDSAFTGVAYGGGIDLATILKAAVVAETGGRMHLAFDIRALPAMEHLFLTRYWNFRTIYWHHTNRAIMAMVLSVFRDLCVEHEDNPLEFLRATVHLDDLGAARWLNERYKSWPIGPTSILETFLSSRNGLYRRLFTARPREKEDEEYALVKDIEDLVGGKDGYKVELELCREVGKRVGARYSIDVGDRDVLLDLPRRKLSQRSGAAYLVGGGEILRLEKMSHAVRGVWDDFEMLSQRTRFFVSPRVAATITKNVRNSDRAEIRGDIVEAIRSVRTSRGTSGGLG